MLTDRELLDLISKNAKAKIDAAGITINVVDLFKHFVKCHREIRKTVHVKKNREIERDRIHSPVESEDDLDRFFGEFIEILLGPAAASKSIHELSSKDHEQALDALSKVVGEFMG